MSSEPLPVVGGQWGWSRHRKQAEVCIVEGCDSPTKSRDLCNRHYQQASREHLGLEIFRGYGQRFRVNHPERWKESNKRYYAENKERMQARQIKYRADHPEKVKEWKAKYGADYAFRRRARKLAAFVEDVKREVVIIRDRSICHICKEIVLPHEIEIDHIIPLSRGGEHSYANVAVSHGTCNRKKSDKCPPLDS